MSVTPRQIHRHFQSVGPWVNWEQTCDGFKYGDPDVEIKGIAVAWQATQSALEEAHALGNNLFITHEPTFYSHMDDDATLRASEPAQRKMAFLDHTGMVVYRCHDLWDVYPELGIVDAWSAYLGLGEPVAREKYYNVHAVPSTTAWEITHRIARTVAPLGQQAVQLVGTKWQMVHRLAVGTGAITNVRRMVALGADIVLATDDGTTLWRDGAWMADLGVPLILLNHTTAEIPGMRNLVAYLESQFPGVPVRLVGQTCGYEILATERTRDIGIRMRRDDLENLPSIEVADGYQLRSLRPGEEWAYVQVMNKSNFAGDVDRAWFDRTFANDTEYDPSYLQLIWKGDQPVAAATAWHNHIEGERWGMIHWVGTDRDERGRGLGKSVTLAALHKLRERGLERAMLDTGDWRLPAVAAYLRLGFKPWPTEKTPQAVWDQVLADLASWRRLGRQPHWDER